LKEFRSKLKTYFLSKFEIKFLDRDE